MTAAADIHVLIDGTNLVHRVYHALAHATRADRAKLIAAQVHALAGLGSRVAIAWDGPDAGGWRRELYPAYKANRGEKPGELVELLESAKYWSANAAGLESIEVPGAEADDVIATLWARAFPRGQRVVVVSGDRDLYQLLRPGLTSQITGYKTHRGQLVDVRVWTAALFEAEMGFSPILWPTYRALVGDKSDNIPGVLGLGPTAAGHICRRYMAIEDAMADLWAVPLNARQRTALSNAWADGTVRRYIDICTLRRNVATTDPGMETLTDGIPATA